MRRLWARWFLPLCVVTNGLSAQPFFFRQDIPVGVDPVTVVVADFNRDGRPDLAVTTREGLFIVLNEGERNFGQPVRIQAPVAKGSLLFAGDFNGDGNDDLVTGDGLLLISNGEGTFSPPRRAIDPVADGPTQAAGDFNRDGKLDLLVSRYAPAPSTDSIRVWLGNGDGTFRPGEISAGPTGMGNHAVVIADFNRDGVSDMAIPPFPRSPVLVLLGKGDGTFGPEIRTPLDAEFGWPLLVADFNGDGLPDLATAGGILLGKGDGSFQPPVTYSSWGLNVSLVSPLTAADLTGDGKADLVMARSWTNSILIYPGKGDGTFLSPIEQAVGWLPYWNAAAVDLDGDGRLDLVIPNSFALSNTVSVLLSKAQGGAAVRRALSAASGTAIVAPGCLATLFAPTTATASAIASPPWLTRLGGISLEIRDSAGATRLAPLVFVSPTQINFQVPADTALGEAALAVVADGGSTPIGGMWVDAVAPGLFLMSHFPAVPAATGVRVEADGAQVPIPVFSCSGSSCKLEPIPLSTAGDRPMYLSFFGTGLRGANANNVTCSIGYAKVPVAYAGPQGTPGLDQINVRVPPAVLNEDGFYEVSIRINGVAANLASIDVR